MYQNRAALERPYRIEISHFLERFAVDPFTSVD
jgi:hypothetical protein